MFQNICISDKDSEVGMEVKERICDKAMMVSG